MSSQIRNNFSIPKGINLYFMPNRSLLFMKNLWGIVTVRLPSFYFYCGDILEVKKTLSIMFLSRFYFISFIKHLKYLSNRLSVVYFLKLRLKGLGYRIRKICNSLYRFYFTTTNYIYFHIPLNLLFRARKRRMILLSNNYQLLRTIFVHILLLRKLSPYNRRGIFYPRQIVLLKPGKKIV